MGNAREFREGRSLLEAIEEAQAGGMALEPCIELRDGWTASAARFLHDHFRDAAIGRSSQHRQPPHRP